MMAISLHLCSHSLKGRGSKIQMTINYCTHANGLRESDFVDTGSKHFYALHARQRLRGQAVSEKIFLY